MPPVEEKTVAVVKPQVEEIESDSFESDDEENLEDEMKRMKTMTENQIRRMTQRNSQHLDDNHTNNKDSVLHRAKSYIHLDNDSDVDSDHLPIRRSFKVNFDRMKNFYVSPVCRLQFLYLLYNRTWAYLTFSVAKDEGVSYVTLQDCGRRTNTHE